MLHKGFKDLAAMQGLFYAEAKRVKRA